MPSMSSALVHPQGVATTPTNTLTPTTLRNITQILESEECLKNIHEFETTGGFQPPVVSEFDIPSTIPDLHEIRKDSSEAHIDPSIPSSTGPISTITYVNLDSKSWHGGTTTIVTPSQVIPHIVGGLKHEEDDDRSSLTPSDSDDEWRPESISRDMKPTTRRSSRSMASTAMSANANLKRKANRNGGRKPAKRAKSQDNMNPEESERVRVRRLRNKEAAARCRKRRMDLIDQLSEEVEGLQSKRRALEKEIQQLKGDKDELKYILETHQQTCSLHIPSSTSTNILSISGAPSQPRTSSNVVVAVKSEPCVTESAQDLPDLFTTINNAPLHEGATETHAVPFKPKRPATLSLDVSKNKEVHGVMIETPSSIITTLGFENVTTGFTPNCPMVSSITTSLFTPTLNTPTNCSSQQRSSSGMEMANNGEFLLL
ncbi:hypothetical protein TCAL_11019 [Tigriopus californicus]|uniref:BZIP domain-containing protein n=2 Tax=Tigriopus californicus TaxID=6832 RepID=A0A553NSY7_TIGCA|nr:hypothetical protein TCAL_11019 [Tigriopus californicus]|eukprot:TCALIF_11019-PA protein Name:"Similar to kay Transcription factor kayak (Drosophila sechellia)" AED:0.13 eAED:0.14 QI:0/-1/0/1/-1/1/1/0/428